LFSPPIPIEAAGRSAQGRLRDINQDSFTVRSDLGLYILADGMGGHVDGEVASAIAVEAIPQFFEKRGTTARSDAHAPPVDPLEILVGAVRHAHARLRAQPEPPRGMRRMGTTIAAVRAEPGSLCVAHVGDSRVYRLRGRRLVLLTRDHTRMNEYLNMGATPEAAARMRDAAALSRALGTQERINVDVRREDAEPGDLVLLCTDGLSNVVSDEQLALVLAGRSDLDATVAALMSIASARGATDDVTCILVRWGESRDVEVPSRAAARVALELRWVQIPLCYRVPHSYMTGSA
jgi:protein phosphatase